MCGRVPPKFCFFCSNMQIFREVAVTRACRGRCEFLIEQCRGHDCGRFSPSTLRRLGRPPTRNIRQRGLHAEQLGHLRRLDWYDHEMKEPGFVTKHIRSARPHDRTTVVVGDLTRKAAERSHHPQLPRPLPGDGTYYALVETATALSIHVSKVR